jgi:WD40 repeat protein
MEAQRQALKATDALARTFAERGWSASSEGDTSLTTKYALAGLKVAPANASIYRAPLAFAMTTREGFAKVTSKEHLKTITALAVSPDGKNLVSGGEDGLAIVWELPSLTKKFLLRQQWACGGLACPS